MVQNVHATIFLNTQLLSINKTFLNLQTVKHTS